VQLRALELFSPTTQTHNATPQLSKGVGSWAAFLFALGARPARSSADSSHSPLAIMLFFFSVLLETAIAPTPHHRHSGHSGMLA